MRRRNKPKAKKKPPQQKRRPTTEPTFADLLRRGTELLQRGRVQQATGYLQQAYELDAKNLDVALNLGGAYILSKKFKQAVVVLEPLVEAYPENGMVWTNLGAAYLGNPILAKDENQLKAIEAFESALKCDPIAPNVAYNIGLIYRDRQDFEQAASWFRKAIQASPNDKDARNYLQQMEERSKKLAVDVGEDKA